MHYLKLFELRIAILLGVLLSCLTVNAQEQVPFTARQNLNVKGDITMIGNNIVNRKTDSYTYNAGTKKHPNWVTIPGRNPNDNYPYDSNENGSTANDSFDMRYIDVDGDGSTFSSSKATLSIPDMTCSKIKYAALYWSATYRYNNSDGTGGRDVFNIVKLKRPGDAAYTSVTGTTIFDGLGTSNDANSPYVCYANVTTLLQGLANPNGEYTVANIRATQGTFGGGISGGWNLFVVYENPNLPGKYISTFDGFVGVNSSLGNIEISYSGFTTVPAPLTVKAKLAAAALEGDKQITGDQLLFKSGSNAYAQLSNTKNPATNFFNSNITQLDATDTPIDFTARVPNSANTLGFDSDIIAIPNGYLPNSATSASLKLISTQDTYYMFFNALAVDIIEPDITLVKTVENTAGQDIGGQDVHLSDLLDYVITFDNVGNDHAVNFTITDVLPVNTFFQSIDLSDVPGAAYVYDAATGKVTITIPDNLVKKGNESVPHEIRIRVRVASSCNELTDHCANRIQNSAYSSYKGFENATPITNDPSIAGIGTCGDPILGPANFLVDVDNCTYVRNEILCGASLVITAGDGYPAYHWYKEDGATDIDMGTTQSITVTEPGQYYVIDTPTPPCIGLTETINVTLSNDITAVNPVQPFADEYVKCSNNGVFMPNIFLCGINDSRFIQSGVASGTVTWQKLDEAACLAACAACMSGPEDCAHNDPACATNWHDIVTAPNYTVTDAGEYRLIINSNGCTATYYFNVYKNNLDPQVQTKNIVCSTPGEIKIVNVPAGYEYQLIDQATNTVLIDYPNINATFPINTTGVYTVKLRQIGVTDGCIFTLADIGIMTKTMNVTVIPTDKTCTDAGTIRVQALNVSPQYYYTITSGAFTSTHGPVTDNNHLFTGLNAGTYTVEVTTDDGCTYSGNTVVNDYSNLSLNATVAQSASCDPGLIQLTPAGGLAPYSFAYYSIDGVLKNPGLGDFILDNPVPIDAADVGTYVFITKDANGCTVQSNPVTIQNIPGVAYTTASENVSCNGADDGSITVNVTSNSGYTVSFELLDATNTQIGQNASGVFTGLTAGDYTVNVVQAGTNTCRFPETFTITEPDALTGTASITQQYTCANGGATIVVDTASVTGGTGAYTYSIDGITFGTATTFTGLTNGTYTVTIKDGNGCTLQTAPMTVNPLTSVTNITFGATAVTCPAQTSDVTLTATGGVGPFNYEITAPSAVNNGTNAVFAGLAPNTYTFKVTDANGCTFTKNYTINGITPISVTGQNISNVSCFNAADGELTYTVSGFGTNYNYSVVSTGTAVAPATGVTSGTINLANLAAGSYTITVTDPATNCNATAAVIIQNPTAALAITKTVVQPTCTATGSVTIAATGGWGSNSYQLSGAATVGPQSSSVFSGLTAGSYTITVTDANGCAVQDNFTLNTAVPPVVTIAGSSDICYDANGASLTAAVNAGTGTAPFQYQLNSGSFQSNATFSNLSPGSYTITVRDANGCTDTTATQTIGQQLTAPVVLTKGLDCSGNPNAEITVTINGGIAPFTYEVKIGAAAYGTSIMLAGNIITYPVATADTYQFRITDANGCTVQTSATTVAPITPPAITSLTPTNVLCNGSSTGAIAVAIDNTVGTAPYTIDVVNTDTAFSYGTQTTGLPAGNYDVTVTDSNGCTATDSTLITEPDAIDFNISKVDITCNNPGGTSYGEINIVGLTGGTAPFTYYLSNNFGDTEAPYTATTGEDHTFIVLNFGIYKVEVIDANGCSLIENNIIIASPPSDLTIDVTAVTSDCTAGGTAEVTVSAAVVSNNYEFGILTSNSLPYASPYFPSDGGTPLTRTFTGLIPGVTYTFVVHDLTTGCYYFKSATAPVTSPSGITATVTPKNVTCTGNADGKVSFTVSGYDATATQVQYEIFRSPSTLTTGITGTLTGLTGAPATVNDLGNLAPGDYYILFTELDGGVTGCTNTSPIFTITQSSAILELTAAVTKNDNCGTNAGIITATAQFGTAPYQYQLALASDAAPTAATWAGSATNIFNAEGDDYIVYAKDANNCIQPFAITLPTDPSPLITATVNNQCNTAEGSYSILVNRTQDGIAPYSYSFNGGAFQPQASASFTYDNLTSGSYNIIIRDANGCTDLKTVNILAPVMVSPTVSAQPTCADNDGQITVTGFGGSGNYEYELEFAAGGTAALQQASNIFTGLAADDYKVIIYDMTSTCTEEALVSLDAAIPVDFTTAKTDVSCNGGNDSTITITLNASNTDTPYSYTIDGLLSAPIVQSSPLFTGLAADTYTITVTSGKNCTDTDTVTINQPVALAVSAVATPFACATDNTVQTSEIAITATNGTSPYTYSINGINYFTTNIFNVPDTGSVQNITVYVKDANNCTETFPLTIDPLPVMSAATVTQVTEITCANDETVAVEVTGGSGNYKFELLPSGPVFTPGVGVTAANFDLSTPDDYTFKVTDLGTQCTITTATYTVSPFDTIDAVATAATQVTCFGGTDGTITINVTGYTGAYNYEVRNTWGVVASGTGNTSTNPFTISNVPAGSLFVRVIGTDTPFCSADTAAITVASPADALVLSANQTASVTCTNNLGEILAQASGGWGTYEYELINTTTTTTIQAYDANNVFTDLTAGNYTVNVRDAGGCIVTQTLTLTQPALITASINASATAVLCHGDNGVTIQASAVSGGQGTYQYILNTYDATGTTIVMSSGAQASPVFTGLGAGIYSITVTDGWSCDLETVTVTVDQPDLLVGTLSVTTQLTCLSQAQLTISAVGGTGPYQFSTDGVTYDTINTFDVSAGTYQYYVKDSNGCAAVLTNSVTILPVPALNLNLNLAGAHINCAGGNDAEITADATGGLGNYQYELLDSNTAPITVLQPANITGNFTGLVPDDYYVRVTSGDCVVISGVISITEPPALVATPIVTPIVCFGETNGRIEITTTGGTGIVQYAISPNLDQFDSNNIFTDLTVGFYDVIVQDQNGCFTYFEDLEITMPDPIDATIVNVTDETCLGSSDATIEVTITGGTGNYVISIDNTTFVPVTGSSHTLTGLSAGTTTVYIKDANDCALNPPITQPILPGVNMDPQVVVTPTCASNTPDNDITITIDGSVTAANVTYSLDGVTYQSSNEFFNVGLAPGTYTAYAKHIVPVTMLTCIQTEDFTIDTHDPIAATAAVTADVLCYGDSTGEIKVTATGGTTPLEYAISPLFVYQSSDTFSNLAAATYDIKVRDAIGCVFDITGVVVNQPAAALTATATHTDEICINANDGSITVTPTDGTAPYQVSLNGGTYTMASSAPAVFTGLADGTYTIDVRDASGCTFAQFTETINEGVDLQASIATAQVCDEATITVDVNPAESANVTYYLDGALQASNIIVATGLTSGTHTVTVTHSNTCSASFNFTVAPVIPIVMGATSQTDVNCFGGSDGTATATATGGTAPLTYAIAPNVLPLVYGTYQATGAFTGLVAGDYVINVKDALGCELASSVITVGQPTAALTATATSTDEICINANDGSITVTPTDGTGPYQVSLNGGAFTTPPSAAPITISDLSDATYTIDVRDANGCTYTLPAAITIAEGVDIQGDYQIIPTCNNNVIGNIVFPTVNPNIPASDFECALDGGIFEPADSTFYQDLSAGSHTITFRYLNGCTQDVTFTVPALSPISASITSQTNVMCYGNTTGEITVTATGGTGTLSYAISDQTPPVFGTYQSTGVFTGLATGDYTISIMDDNVGCETQLTTTITEPTAALTATAASTDEICINANDGSITVTPTDGTGPYQVSLNGGAFTTPPSAGPITISNLSDTTYTIDVRDANGCTYTLPAAITIAEGVDIQPSIMTAQVCDETTITVSVNPAIAAIDLTYALDGGTPQASNQFVVTGLTSGSHNVIVSHSNGCNSAPLTFNVAPVIPIVMGATSQTDVNCFGGSDGTATATATGGTAPLTYAIAPNVLPLVYGTYQATGNFTGLAAGDYIINVKDALGCELASSIITVGQPTAALTATATSTDEICINANDGSITVTPTDGTGPYAVSLNGGAFTTPPSAGPITISNLADTTYTIDVRDANGCTYTLPAAITIAEGVDMQPVATVTPTCVSNTPDNDVTIAINPAVPASDVTYSIDGTNYQSSNTFTGVNLTGAIYTAYAQHTNGCIQTTTFTIIDRLPVTATAAVTADVLCYGDSTGEIKVTATGGTTPLEYAISPLFVYQSSDTFSNLAAATYDIKVRDAIGCVFDITGVVVNQPAAALTATATHTDEICINANDGSITVTPTDGTAPYQVSLNGGTYTMASSAPAVFTGLADGTYTIDVRDASGCTFAQFTETINEGVDLQASIATAQVCDEATITVDVNPAESANVTYYLDGALQASNIIVATGLTSGTHTVTVTHSNTCSASFNFTVAPVIPIVMGATSQTDVNCFGGSDGTATATATGGTAPLTYAIAPNVLPLVYGTYQATGAFTGLVAGDYVINVKDALGCELASSVITVGQPTAALTATATSTDEICINANDGSITVTPTDGTGPYAVSLNGGAFTTPPSAGPITISNLADTTYTIDVRDANGCTYTLPAAITIAEGVDIQPSIVTTQICDETTITVSVNPAIAAIDLTYALDGGTPQASNVIVATGLTSGTHTVTVTHSNTCSASFNFTVAPVIPIVMGATSQTDVNCFGGSDGTATATATGGTAPLTYAIAPNVLPLVYGTYQATGAFTGLTAGDYIINVKDALGCELVSSVITVGQPTAALTATATSTDEICINANDGSITVTPTDGTGPYAVSLNGGAFTTPPSAGPITISNLADTTYTIDVRDANGCTYTLPAAITIAEGVDIQGDYQIFPTCTNNVIGNIVFPTVNPNIPASDFECALDGGIFEPADSTFYQDLSAGSHTITFRYLNGCTQDVTFTVPALLPISASITSQTNVMCYGNTTGEITVSATGGTGTLSYAISDQTPPVFGTYQSTGVFTGLAAGDYTISIMDDNVGCETQLTTTITEPTAALTATAASTDEICINANDGTITIVPAGGTAPYETSLNGSAFAAQLSYTGLADAAYTIDVRDANGCTYTLPAAITIAEGVDMQPVATVTPTCVSNTPDNDVTIAINPAVAASDVMYSIDGTNYQSSNTFTGVSLAGATYTAYAQHANGCIQTTTFTIIDRLPVTATAAVTADVLCYGSTTGEITVTATGGTTPLEYAVSTATPPVFTTYQPSNVFAGLAAGDYTISVRDAIGCEVVTTVLTVTQPTAALTATASSTDEICINANDGTITIVPVGGTAPYETSLNGSAFAAQLSYTGLADAAYTIDVRDANGCTYTLPAAITIAEGVDMQPVATVTPTCISNTPDNDVTIAINPAVPASDVMYSIDGTNYQSSNTFTGVSLAGATYTAYAQHANGCIQTTTFTIIDRLPVTATAAVTADVLCYGTTTGEITVTASGGTTPLEYAISTATPPVFTTYQPSNVFAGLAAGDYTISVRDAIGCEVVTKVLTVTQPTAALTATATHTDEICINANNGTITIVPVGGTAPYETSLNGSAFAAQLSYTGLADAAYTIDVRDANGCTYTLPAAITIAEGVDMQPVATVTPTCVSNTPDNDVTIAINPAVAASDVMYSIDGTNYQSSNTFTGVSLAGATYTAYAQHANGCIQTTTFTIIDRLPVTATAAVTADVLCYGTTTGEITVTASGGTTPLEYAISSATPPVFTTYQSSNVFAGLAAGDYTISVRDAIGCEVVTTVLTVTQPTAALTATATHTDEICINANNGTITIVPVGGTAPYETSLNGSAFAAQLSYTGLADAAYTIDVRDANGCTYTLPAAITIAEGVDMQPVATVTPTCVSNTPDNDVTIAINPAVAASDVMYSIDGTNYQSSNTFTGVSLAGATYTAYAQHANGCIQTTTFTIIDRLPVTATAAVTADVLCYGTTTGEITVTASGGTTPLEYAISSATPPVFTTYQSSNVFAGLAAGDYTISVRDAIGCEVVTTVLTVTQPTAALTATASSTDEICINANDGTITIVPVGGTAPYETSLNGSAFAAQLSYTGLADAAYTIDVRDANGCTYTLPAAITIAEGVDMQPVATVTPTCISNTPDNDVTIAINPAVPASDVMYSIDGTNYQSSNTFTGVSLAGATYTAYAQHANGCIQTTTFTIIDRLPVTATAAVTADVLCYGTTTGEITVTASGGTTPLEYAISTATPPVFTTYQPSNVFAGLAAGDYTISVRDAIGCEVVTTMLTITQPTAALAVTVSKTDEQCLNANDGTITIVATGGTAPYQSRIDSAASFTAQMNYTALADGIYDVEVVDANGCSYAEQITIATGIQIQPSLLVTQQCTETTIEVSVNPSVVADVMYSLDGGASQSSNTFVVDGLDSAVTHTITVTHIQGCSETVDFNINPTVPIVMNAPTVTDVACHGKADGAIQVNATGGTGPLQYAITWNIWPTPIYGPSNNFTDLLAGQYTIWVKDAMGCVVTTTIDVLEPAEALTLSAVATAESCINAHDGTITITPQGGVAPYYTAIVSAVNFQQDVLTYSGLFGGTYDVYVRDANGCYAKTTVTIEKGVNLNPYIETTLSCDNNNPVNTVTVLLNPVVQNMEYSLTGTPGSYTANNVFDLAPGSYTVYVKHINGCTAQLDFTVQDRPAVTATASSVDATCNGVNNGSITVTASGGTGTLKYGISPDFAMTQNPVFNNLLAGNYTIRVEDAYGCYTEVPVVVNEPTAIAVTVVDVLQEICVNDDNGVIEIDITGGTGPYATSLTPNGVFVEDQILFDNLDGGVTYTIYVKDTNGCTTTIDVPLDAPMDINATSQVVYNCNDNTVTIITDGNIDPQELTYTLEGPKGNNPPQTSNVFANLQDGTYTVEVLHISGCTDTTSFTIESTETLTLLLAESGLNQFKASTSGGKGPYTYTFEGNDMGTKNTFVYDHSGTYVVTVTDSRGCTTEASIEVKFIDIIIPDVITPGGDGQNDTWSPGNTQNYPNINTDIFDRYGRKVATLRQGQVWDGKYEGNELPTGDYWYLIKLGDADNREFVGHFTIYR